jgi:hypothetical protein
VLKLHKVSVLLTQSKIYNRMKYFRKILIIIPLLLYPSFTLISGGKQGNFSLDDLQRRTFYYFWDLADPVTGLIPDRAPTKSFSSVAAVGFGLSSYIVGTEHGWVSRKKSSQRVLKTLKFLLQLPQSDATANVGGYKGFFYHFLDVHTGYRYQDVELSTIDTGLLMAGILSCYSYFDRNNPVETEIRRIADSLYRRVDWAWFLTKNNALSMGWHPGQGFLESEWKGYNEAMVLIIMAMGSPTHPIPSSCWDVWTQNYNWANYKGQEHVNFGPLFGHQYSHMFIDFKGIQDNYMKDKGIDYFENSRRATYANRAYCIENAQKFKGYGENVWGLTACDGPGYFRKKIGDKFVAFDGYSARGAAQKYLVDDGTIAPTAAGGSVAFAPEICIPVLKEMHDLYGDKLYGKYGFRDAFNPTFTFGKENEKGWFDCDYIGIDQGPIVLMIENYKTGLIWNIFKKNPYIVDGLKKAGFSGGWLDN